MSTRMANSLGSILIQSVVALTLFTAGLGLAKADQTNPEAEQFEQLFDTQAQIQTRAYLMDQATWTSQAEYELFERAMDKLYHYEDRGKHLVSINTLPKRQGQSWPLLSMTVKQGDLNWKLGSKYTR